MSTKIESFSGISLNEENIRYINEPRWYNKKTVKCPVCNAKLLYDTDKKPEKCPYCASTGLSEVTGANSIAPHYVIPFLINREQAKEEFSKYVKSGLFRPNDYKEKSEQVAIEQVYTPYWFFTAVNDTSYRGKVQNQLENYENASATTDSWREFQEGLNPDNPAAQRSIVDPVVGAAFRVGSMYKYTNTAGTHSIRCFGSALGTRHSVSSLVKDVFPFYSSLVAVPNNDRRYMEYEYKPEIINGIPVESYDVWVDEAWLNAQPELSQDMANRILQSEGGDKGTYRMVMNFSDLKIFTFLVPTWICSFSNDDKTYVYAINGQTGKIYGERPTSVLKIVILVGIIIFVLFVMMLVCGFGLFSFMLN